MIAQDAPHRIYSRNQVVHVCFAGWYFAPTAGKTAVNLDGKVRLELLEPVKGKQRVQVTQGRTKEVWREATVPVKHRG